MADLLPIVVGPIYLTEDEIAGLIRHAPHRTPLKLAFGPGFVRLEWRECEWAVHELIRIRDLDPEVRGGSIEIGESERAPAKATGAAS